MSQSPVRLGILVDRIRVEEKLLLAELERRSNVNVDVLYLQQLILDPEDGDGFRHLDLVVDRSVSQSRGEVVLGFMERWGVPTVNRAEVSRRCGDKVATSLALAAANVPQPRLRVATSPGAALEAMEELGYPVVVKPAVGSWGRLLARLNDRDAAEALVEHKTTLGGPSHGVLYIQEFVNKPQRDLRAFVLGDQTLCAIERHASHWITNTARGAQTVHRTVDAELDRLCVAAARAVGGGILAVDLLESPRGLLVNEVNATMEFRNSIEPTGVDIPARMVDYLLDVARRGLPSPATTLEDDSALLEAAPC